MTREDYKRVHRVLRCAAVLAKAASRLGMNGWEMNLHRAFSPGVTVEGIRESFGVEARKYEIESGYKFISADLHIDGVHIQLFW